MKNYKRIGISVLLVLALSLGVCNSVFAESINTENNDKLTVAE